MRKMFLFFYILVVLTVSNSVVADVILRCEGKSEVRVTTDTYTIGFNETCLSDRDLCISEFVDFWLISDDKAIPSNLNVINYVRLEPSPSDPINKEMSWEQFYDDETSSGLLINPTTGEYLYHSYNWGNQMYREGFCDKFSDKKLFE